MDGRGDPSPSPCPTRAAGWGPIPAVGEAYGPAKYRIEAEHGYGSQSRSAGLSGTKRNGRQGMPTLAFGSEVVKFPVQRQTLIRVTGTVEVCT